MTKLEAAFGKWVVRWRWAVIAGTLIALFSASYGTRFLIFNNDTRVFFSEKNPQLQALEALENTYNRIDNVFFILAPKNGNVFTRATLAAVEELTEAGWSIPHSSRVDSITNFQHTRVEEDDLTVEDLVRDAETLSDTAIERIKKIVLSEPQLVHLTVSPSGHVTGVDVNILLPLKSTNEVPKVAFAARKIADDFRKKHPDIELRLGGGIMMDQGFAEASMDDMATLTPIMFLVLLLIVGLSLRSFSATFSTLAVIVMSMLTGLGLAGWMGIEITAASVNATTIIMTLAVADSVHILVSLFHQMRLGKPKHEAIAEALRINLQPIFLTSVTTAIGFLSMNFSDVPPFHDLGNIVAMGVLSAFFYSVLSLPAFIAVLPLKVKSRPEQESCPACDGLASFVINKRTPVFWSSIAAVIFLTAGITRIDLNDNFLKYFDESYEIRQAVDFSIDENLRGWDVIEYSLQSGEPGGINEPSYLNTVEDFAAWYRTQPNVVHVNVITNTVKRLNRDMHGGNPFYYKIPQERNLAAQYLLLYEMSLPFGLDLNNQIDVDKSATRMIVSFRDMTSTSLRETDSRAREWLKSNAPEKMFTYGSGLSIIWAHISLRNIKSMLGAALWALVLISGLLIFAMRSFKLGLLSLIPNLTPAFMAFGVWGMIAGRVGLGLSVIAAMTLGIVVDDTIHFISKYLRAKKELDMDPAGAVHYAFNTVGTAMRTTTLALCGGFLVLSFSHYKMNADMGLMSAITIALALALDFLFLPTLLMKVEKKR